MSTYDSTKDTCRRAGWELDVEMIEFEKRRAFFPVIDRAVV